ncbi:hypothetical protein SLEP1_g26723 [Rubroshorea leprosula]|uniref:Uncharacterized protein n=1 Tax=Rubroshorea leprosula TaxID=152421 RepID=A0AAV5JTH1_9ROSI|nr:hypothetical protein SLEP1_g26723 [Rubroshorea leprosula]
MLFHVKPILIGQNLATRKAVKMEAYVSPTIGDVKERKTGFKEKVFIKLFMDVALMEVSPTPSTKELKNGMKAVMFAATRQQNGSAKLQKKKVLKQQIQRANSGEMEVQRVDSRSCSQLYSFNTKEEYWSCGVKAEQEAANERKLHKWQQMKTERTRGSK